MNTAQSTLALACLAVLASVTTAQQETKSKQIDPEQKQSAQRVALPSHVPPITPLVQPDDRDQSQGDVTDGDPIPPDLGWLGPHPEDVVYFQETALEPPGTVLIQETESPLIITHVWGAVELLVDGQPVFASSQSSNQQERFSIETAVVIPAGVTLGVQSKNQNNPAGFMCSGYEFDPGASGHGWPGPRPQDRFSFCIDVPQSLEGSAEEIAGVLVGEPSARRMMITDIHTSGARDVAEIRAGGQPLWAVWFPSEPTDTRRRNHRMNIPFPRASSMSVARPSQNADPLDFSKITIVGYYY